MKISVFGLGYVGAVTSACLVQRGHTVIGVDNNPTKVDLIAAGKSPIIETDLPEIIASAAADGQLSATTDAAQAVLDTEISLVCVGTPSRMNGSLNLDYLRTVCEEIGAVIKTLDREHIVVIRSTVLPGTMRDLVIPTLEAAAGKPLGDGYRVCNNPEFLREGSAIYDFYNPPKTVVGASDEIAAAKAMALYEGLPGPMITVPLEVSEMVKYTDNCWHALKVGFANEIGSICKAEGVDSHAVIDVFLQDTKLNISTAYLKPGFAFGGSCLPKDLRALSFHARDNDVDTPILRSVLESNVAHIERGIRQVIATAEGKRKIGIAGFSFKSGTDDLRESPMIDVIERLLGKGFDLRIYDKNVQLAKLMGANKAYLMEQIPHISSLLVDSLDELLDHGEVIVIGNGAKEFADLPVRLGGEQKMVDLVRIIDPAAAPAGYDGICW